MELPQEKRKRLLKSIKSFLLRKSCKIIHFAQLLGLLNAACPGIKYGRLYTKTLERAKYLALRANYGNYKSKMKLSMEVKHDLRWWLEKLPREMNVLRKENFLIEICTDASLSGWGAYCQGKSACGWWSLTESEDHINLLELRAIFLGLKCFAGNLKDCNILIRTDNTTALSYVNKMGSVKFPKLNNLARSLWKWCENKNIWIFASYIQSKENWQADQASRTLPKETEWSLNNNIFNDITQQLGQPDIDLFASVANNKCKRYFSWYIDPESEAIDAFTVSWSNLSFYAFPPFALILRTLQKIINDKATGIMVVPFWKTQPWYPLFVKLTVGHPLFFGPNNDILFSPYSKVRHPMCKDLILVAAKLSGKHSEERESQKAQLEQW
ncbi:uncharacterized protein LOC115877950 [Sitophilus oryzae]|uniref:Uncharacterized protein LOC115877950 n=1 Tax=Sitophilus oryzae TaxID=7048 RepID=A0A6J2XGU1_SITOR|nr:uncharacterized protein LOC115877950 [Sitophilus oryzae]